jgi:hypothetical protein
MGEFTTGSGDTHNPENVTMGTDQTGAEGMSTDNSQSGFDTDVPDVRADDIVRQGKDEFPCFDVDKGEFYQNMQDGRRRLRFKSGSNAQQYMSKTKYNRPFYIRHTDDDGKKFVRRIK